MKVIVIFNPASGLRKNNEFEMISDFLKNREIDFDIVETTIEVGPYQILSKVVEAYDSIITCGGDGTISETIRGIHDFGFKLPLLIVPIGTSNEIAQNLGLGDDSLLKILNRLVENKTTCVDYGVVNNKDTFTYALTFGNFTDVTYKTPQKMKNWMGYRAYLLYGFLSFRRVKSYRLQLESNDYKISGNYLFGTISNSATIGNIIRYDKDSFSLSDGEFEVLLISKPRSVKEIRLIIIGLLQNDYTSEMFTTFKSNQLSIKSQDEIDWNIDGEFAGTYNKLDVNNIHQKIKIII